MEDVQLSTSAALEGEDEEDDKRRKVLQEMDKEADRDEGQGDGANGSNRNAKYAMDHVVVLGADTHNNNSGDCSRGEEGGDVEEEDEDEGTAELLRRLRKARARSRTSTCRASSKRKQKSLRSRGRHELQLLIPCSISCRGDGECARNKHDGHRYLCCEMTSGRRPTCLFQRETLGYFTFLWTSFPKIRE